LLARKATRRQRQSNTLTVSSLLPQRAPIDNDPPSREKSITVNQVFQSAFELSNTPKQDITPAFIATSFPGAAFWSRFRIEKIAIWGRTLVSGTVLQTSGAITVDIPADVSWNQPPMRLTDDGIEGQSRPKIAFKLGLLDRARFFTPADETIICSISGSANELITCQFTLQLVSPAVA